MVFAFDLSIPLGVAAGVPYIAVILLAWRITGTRCIILFAVTASILTITGYFLSPLYHENWQVISNRALALFAIWVTAILTIRFKNIVKERETAEAKTRDLQADLASFSKLSTMGEMAVGVAHEINQPLTAISTYAEVSRRLIQKDPINKESLEDCVEKISEQASRAGNVIRSIRDFVKKGEMNCIPVNINDLIHDVIVFVEIDATKHGFVIELDLAEDLPLISVDAIQIQQVIINIIRNGLDAMEGHCDKGESLVIKTRRRDDNFIELVITDRGKGISEALDDQIFEPLVTTKNKGMGMGLSISRSIINSHGGLLSYASNADRGVSFFCRLPVADADCRVPAP